jgi:hypothetical protein
MLHPSRALFLQMNKLQQVAKHTISSTWKR